MNSSIGQPYTIFALWIIVCTRSNQFMNWKINSDLYLCICLHKFIFDYNSKMISSATEVPEMRSQFKLVKFGKKAIKHR